MSTVEEIEKAIEQLPKGDIWQLDEWFVAFRNRLWDEQMEADAESGHLDSLFKGSVIIKTTTPFYAPDTGAMISRPNPKALAEPIPRVKVS